MAWMAGVLGLVIAQCGVLTFAAIHLGRRWRILDFPDKERKQHARATPRMGGVAVFCSLVLGLAEWVVLSGAWNAVESRETRYVAFLLLSAALLCGLGLWDDKFGLKARSKLFGQFVAIAPFVWLGRSTTTADLLGQHVDFAWLAVPVVLFWLVSCTNFVNLVDGLDGLASTVSLIVAATVAGLAWLNDQAAIFAVAAVLSASLVGFLLHNWPPARIFLGDSGSMPLGFLIGALALEASAKKAAGLTLAVPLVLLGIPMFDTSMAILRRKLQGQKIGQGDRAHIHHCLRDRGLSPTQTLLAIAGMCSVTAGAALAATVWNNDLIALGICGTLLVILIGGRVFGYREMELLTQHVRATGEFLRSAPRTLRAKFVVVRLAGSVTNGRLDLWQKLIRRAGKLHAQQIEFVCEHAETGEELAALTWASEVPVAPDAAMWEQRYEVPRERGVRTTVRVVGALTRGNEAGRINELSELLFALCRNWPIPGEISQATGSDSDHEIKARILPVHRDIGITEVPSQGKKPRQDQSAA